MKQLQKKLLQVSPYVYICSENDTYEIRNILNNQQTKIERKLLSIFQKDIMPAEEWVAWLGNETTQRLYHQAILTDARTVWREYNIQTVDIEIGENCNWRCEYCPQRMAPKPVHYMERKIWEKILERILQLPTVPDLTLHHFNEPLLDPLFDEKIKTIAQHGLKMSFHTNASLLDEKKLGVLTGQDVLKSLVFNLPSIDRDRFYTITKSKMLTQTLTNIKRAAATGIPVMILCNGCSRRDWQRDVAEITDYFAVYKNVTVCQSFTNDRGGLLSDKYYQNIHMATLYGCAAFLSHVSIGINGEVFICCQDYDKKYTLGNVLENTLDEILTSSRVQQLKKQIFGKEKSPEDFLCKKCAYMKMNELLFRTTVKFKHDNII